jgi:hypothetical protein
MAVDELLNRNFGLLSGFVSGSWMRWVNAAMQARAGTYTQALLFNDLMGQFVHGWNTWDTMMAFTGSPVTPTVTIRDARATIAGKRNHVYVPQRLTGATFSGTILERFGGSETIPALDQTGAGGYHVVTAVTDPPPPPPFGDLDGRATLVLDATPPVVGTYRGLVLVREAGAAGFVPMAWLMVVAE